MADLQQVIDILNNDGIIIYPADTVYAIGCHGLKERATERICQLRAIDPKKNNLSIICYNLSNISGCAKFDNNTFRLMERSLPSPFTPVLNGTVHLLRIFRSHREIGIYMPDNPIIQELACFLDALITTTILPYKENRDIEYCTGPKLTDERFGNIVDLIVDGGIGGIESSTIVDCTNGEAEIVRQGES